MCYVCAWCKKHMVNNITISTPCEHDCPKGQVSHGICLACKDVFFKGQ